jgi:hypothetical protein
MYVVKRISGWVCAEQKKIPSSEPSNLMYTGNGTDSWFLESNGKKVQWDFSLIINRDPHGTGLFVTTGIYVLLPVM